MDSAVVVMGSHLSGALVRAVVLAWSHLSEVRSRTNGPRCGASGFRSFASAPEIFIFTLLYYSVLQSFKKLNARNILLEYTKSRRNFAIGKLALQNPKSTVAKPRKPNAPR